MYQRQNLYETAPNQYRGVSPAQSPMQTSPTQPANSYTIDIAPTSYTYLPDNQQRMGQPAPTPTPTYNGYPTYQTPLSQQQSPISPLSYTTSPSIVSPPPQNSYSYQTASPNTGMPNFGGGMLQAPMTSVQMPPPLHTGLSMNYSQPPPVDTTPRFSIPPPSNGMMSPQNNNMMSPQPMASPYSPGFNSTYPGQPLMSPSTAHSQPQYSAVSPQTPINYNQINMY